jgi:hypothetical protein
MSSLSSTLCNLGLSLLFACGIAGCAGGSSDPSNPPSDTTKADEHTDLSKLKAVLGDYFANDNYDAIMMTQFFKSEATGIQYTDNALTVLPQAIQDAYTKIAAKGEGAQAYRGTFESNPIYVVESIDSTVPSFLCGGTWDTLYVYDHNVASLASGSFCRDSGTPSMSWDVFTRTP